MTSRYPVQIDSSLTLPTVADNFTPVSGSVVNNLRDAVLNVQKELGVKPSGTFGTLRARVDDHETNIAALETDRVQLGGDIGGTVSSPAVLSLTGISSIVAGPSLALSGYVKFGSVAGTSGSLRFPMTATNIVSIDDGVGGQYHVLQYSSGSSSTTVGKTALNLELEAATAHINATNLAVFGASNTSVGFGGGSQVVSLPDATTVPTTNPTGGIVIYSESGVLKYRDASGTIYTLDNGVTFAGDISGTDTSQTVVAIQNRAIGTGTPNDGDILKWNATATEWQAQPLNIGSFSAGGDLTGSDTSQQVIGLTGTAGVVAGPSTAITVGASPASTGAIRLANNTSIKFRNSTDLADLTGVEVDSGNWMYFGGSSSTHAGASVNAGAGDLWINAVNGLQKVITWDALLGSYVERFYTAYNHRLEIGSTATNSVTGKSFTIQGQNATGTTTVGGSVVVTSGTGTAFNGTVDLQTGGTTMLSVCQPANGQRVLSLVKGGFTFGSDMPANTGDRVVYLANAATSPSANPVNGVILYSDSGTFKARNTDGGVYALSTDPTLNGLRLTLTTNTPITSSDVTSSSTLYFTPYTSGLIYLWDGSAWVLRSTNEISLSLSGLTTDKNYDVFAYWNGSAVALELSAAWTNDTTRSSALTRQDGILVKTGAVSRRYVGTIRATGSTTTADSKSKRFVWNYYNKTERNLQAFETASNWSYSSSSFRAARTGTNTTTNSFEFVTGDTQFVYATVNTFCTTTTVGFGCTVGIGLDSTTVNSATSYGSITNAVTSSAQGLYIPCQAFYEEYPTVGYHRLTWLEISGGATLTFYGNIGQSTFFRYGMYGRLQG